MLSDRAFSVRLEPEPLRTSGARQLIFEALRADARAYVYMIHERRQSLDPASPDVPGKALWSDAKPRRSRARGTRLHHFIDGRRVGEML